jgi:hypothetical protein
MTRLIFATILLFGFHSKTPLPIVEISSIDKDILLKYRVDCAEFNNRLSEQKELTTIKGQRRVKILLSELENLERSTDKTDTDTRAQITITYQDHVDEFCADKFSICRSGNCYKMTDKLAEIIW